MGIGWLDEAAIKLASIIDQVYLLVICITAEEGIGITHKKSLVVGLLMQSYSMSFLLHLQ